MPTSLAACARALRLHWAEPSSSRATSSSACLSNRPGGAFLTSAISLLRSASVSRLGRPLRGRSPSPSMPSASKRCKRRRTVWALHCNSLAMVSTRFPSQLSTTMRAWVIQSAGPCRLAASFLTWRASWSSCAALTRRIFGISSLLAASALPPFLFYHYLTNGAVEAVRKGQRSHFPLLGFHWLLEPLALQAKAHLNENISSWLLEWLARAKQLINATWLQKAFRTASSADRHLYYQLEQRFTCPSSTRTQGSTLFRIRETRGYWLLHGTRCRTSGSVAKCYGNVIQ